MSGSFEKVPPKAVDVYSDKVYEAIKMADLYTHDCLGNDIISSAELLFVKIGALATYFGHLGLLDATETGDVISAVLVCQSRLLKQCPLLEERAELYENAKKKVEEAKKFQTPPSSPRRSDRAPSTPPKGAARIDDARLKPRESDELAEAQSLQFGMLEGDDDLSPMDGVGRRVDFVEIQAMRATVQGGLTLDEEIRAHFEKFTVDALKRYGPGALLHLVQAIIISNAIGHWDTVTKVSAAPLVLEGLYRLSFCNDKASYFAWVCENAARGILTFMVGAYSNTVLARKTLAGGLLSPGRVSVWYQLTNGLKMGSSSLQSQAVIWAADRRWTSMVPSTLPHLEVGTTLALAISGIGILIAAFNQREERYAQARLKAYYGLNNMEDAVLWKDQLMTSLKAIRAPGKQDAKMEIGRAVQDAFNKRTARRQRGRTRVAQIEQYNRAMLAQTHRIRQLLRRAPREHDINI